MSDHRKTRKQIRKEAKELIAADRLRERDTLKKRKAENKGKPFGVKWEAYWQEVANNRLVRKQRKQKIKNLQGAEKKDQKQLVKKYQRIRYRRRNGLIFFADVVLIIGGFNIAATILNKRCQS